MRKLSDRIFSSLIMLAVFFGILPAYARADGERTASITVIYRDEEQNVIRSDSVFTLPYTEGEEYVVPDELKADFAVKTDGGYNLFRFNEGKSVLSAPFEDEMTITLVFNNVDQYAFYEDFEDYTVDTSKWHQKEGSAPVISEDETRYMYHTTGSTTTAGYMNFDEVDAADSKVRISFDLRLTTPNGQGESQFTIGNTAPSFNSNNINYGVNSTSSGHIIAFVYAAKTGSFTVNGNALDKGFLDDWMHVEADVDFGSKAVSMKITNAFGMEAEYADAKIFSPAFAQNIGSFYMRSGGANGSVSLDNLAVKITGKASAAVPNIESVINFKSIYAFGDSIVYGHNSPQQSFMRLIANDYSNDLNMMAKNGATIMKSSNHILTQVKNAPAQAPDFVVFDGYTNDAYDETLYGHEGVIQGPEASSFDNTTFSGAFEEILYTMKQKWPESEIVFVTIHKSGGRGWEAQNTVRDLSMEICGAWGIHIADMFTYVNADGKTLDTRNADEMAKYIINGAGSHPNVAACKEFYIPAIVEVLEGIVNGGEPTAAPTEEPTAAPTQAPPAGKITRLTVDYNADGTLQSVVSEIIDKPEYADDVNTDTHRVLYWSSVSGMEPITIAQRPQETAVPTEAASAK